MLGKISSMQSEYEANGGSGLSKDALVLMGAVAHTYQDATSPMHGHDKIYSLPMKETTISILGYSFTLKTIDADKFAKEQKEHSAGENHEPPQGAKDWATYKSRTFFLLAFGEKHFKKLRMSEEERNKVRKYAEQLKK